MNKRQVRLAQIVDILLHNSVGSQDDLLHILKQRNFNVTQATLSRDLKTLRTSKVATEMGGYRYVINSGSQPDEETPMPAVGVGVHHTIVSVTRSSGFVVIKTRLGYAPGVAYDIDIMDNPHLIGSIAGSDTIFVAMNPKSSLREVHNALSILVPAQVLSECSDQFSE